MSITLSTYNNGDVNYVAKLNSDNSVLAVAINALQAALATSGVSSGPFLNALFGLSTAFVGAASYAQSTASTTMTLQGGYSWRPDLGLIVNKFGTTALNFAAQTAGTYYIVVDASGTPSIQTSPASALWSVVWTGSAFGAIARTAPIVWNFQDWEDAQSSTALGASYASLDARLEAGETIAVAAAPKASPTLTGVPLAPTAAPGTNTLQIATAAFVQAAISTLAAGLVYKGIRNATTNSPAITSGLGTLGWFYKVGTAGTTTVDGNSLWIVGDILLYDGTVWDKIDGNSTEVTSVAGRVGAVVLALADLPTEADSTLIGNISGGSAVPAASTVTAVLDHVFGSTRGMVLYRGVSAWAALGAGTDGQLLRTHGTSGDPSWDTQPFDMSGYYSGLPTAGASKVLVSVPIARAVTFAANFAGCYMKLRGTTATASTAFDIQKNGSSIGTATFAISGSSATFVSSGGTAQSFAAGDLFALVAPATPDTTADNMGWVFAGTR